MKSPFVCKHILARKANLVKAKVILLFAACCMLINGVAASEGSVNPFLFMFGNIIKLTKQDIPALADYELLILDRWRFHQINNNTWKEIKKASPNTKIFLYQLGPVVQDNADSRPVKNLNNLGRFDVSRGSSDGSLNGDHPDWFLINIFGKRTGFRGYPADYWLDFGNVEFVDYWIKHSLEDISFQEWRADGIFIDVAHACQDSKVKYMAGYTPAKYLTCESWDKNMNGYLARASTALHKQKQLVAANRGQSRHAKGMKAWLDLEKISSPLDVLIEEGAFATAWGDGDVVFLPLEEWKRQLDLPASIKRSAIGMISHTDLAAGGKGVARNGEPVTYEQILRFAAGSYLLARNIDKPKTYFMFNDNREEDRYRKLVPTAMYAKFDIGVPQARYEKVSDKEIYFRKYSDGYVYVNPTSSIIKDIKLPSSFRPRRGNENVRKVDTSLYLDLKPHDAAIVQAAEEIVLPISPSFELQ